ncbi:GAF domain-containing protein [Pseudonocardia sp. C8]|uniref:sigma-54-dependent Fis family transcriptional regulator n=1 Tax=Pseudonocardia sp. C8 TaxID=2762759 RepID=UPI00164257C3|nr:helix-turn-helix domain-containing protein [Pseudonocardia sp. C8]MBC3193126.1 GAF domain-containing protein [Pseudonocardia sp. C8]
MAARTEAGPPGRRPHARQPPERGGVAAARGRPPAGPGTEDLARARVSFLLDEPVQPGVVREPILASWTRSLTWRVPADHIELPYADDVDVDTPLARAARPVLREVADQFATEPVSVLLCDADAVVLDRRTGDPTLESYLDQVLLAPGFSYAERHVGTNGIGSALEGGGPAQVFGHEHYVEHLEDLACAGVPIRHPGTGRVLGVVDVTCWRSDAGTMMTTAVASVARRIEEAVLEHAGRREHLLLQDYLQACRRNRGAVFAIGADLLMMNDRARELFDPGDQAPLLAEAAEALGSGRARQLVVDLPSGLTARVYCKPSFCEAGVSGGVLQVHPVAQMGPAERGNAASAHAPPLPTAVGSSTSWRKCAYAIDRHFQAQEWLILEGEPGVGKATLARATHQNRTPARHVRLLDADGYGPHWIGEVVDELENGASTLILTHLDQLPAHGVDALTHALDPYREATGADRPWVVATVTRGSRHRSPDLAGLLSCFPRTVEVPALRHHIEDVAELVPHLLGRLARGTLTCSPEAMHVLMRNRWPGNVEQLRQVLRKVVAKRRVGVVEAGDLPPECRATTRRVLTPLEAIECDAIIQALLDTDGNKVEAARLLGSSRATIYRKIREYGISMPGPLEAVQRE